MRDDRLEGSHDFSNKRGVVHSEVMLPKDAPEQWRDREQVWNDVEAFEVRKDAQLAREVEFAPPREMTQAQGIELARGFVQEEFVDEGMIADLNVHWDMAEEWTPKPHAHVMLTMRSVDESGFGQKVRDWNRTEMVERWRERWAEHVNERLAELDIDARIDHRSLETQGIGLEPQTQIGAPAQRIEGEGLEAADRAEMHREIAHNNDARIIVDPSVAFDPSLTSNRHSRGATWRCLRIGTATELSSSTRSWARAERARAVRTRLGRTWRGPLHHPRDGRGRTALAPRRRTHSREGTA
ncbi:MobA/MobL family protein [Hwanghaeella sp. 1Z406]|jgi:ATP-dependent exoDNAse (exonuclease V) alpha subunit|uniref:MobA/MobL family protein n=1 Tax=Hwanghaeella sp. 1Z406 TaxID=3402811 RepID=UPI003B674BB4|tara:strand:- start:123029 stop:123919 length:891 start_codon:yes stop_codon:yes gene_type:complete